MILGLHKLSEGFRFWVKMLCLAQFGRLEDWKILGFGHHLIVQELALFILKMLNSINNPNFMGIILGFSIKNDLKCQNCDHFPNTKPVS